MNLLEKIELFEHGMNCSLAFHDFTGDLAVLAAPDELTGHHQHPWCEAERGRSRKCYQQCVTDDTVTRCMIPQIKHCHAGFYELMLPIFKFKKMIGIMFAGVYRTAEAITPELRFFAELFAEGLRRELESSVAEDYIGIREKIVTWFEHSARNPDVAIANLAEYLKLSVSRTSQLMRSQIGMTFPAYLRRCRIQCARQILEHSGLPLKGVAQLAGFHSVNYFHRAFSAEMKITPEQYRVHCVHKSYNHKKNTQISHIFSSL